MDEKRAALRGHCAHCERGLESGRDQRWEAPDGKGHKDLKDYSIYCVTDVGHGAVYPQFIAHKQDWTGLIPKWCPLLEEENHA